MDRSRKIAAIVFSVLVGIFAVYLVAYIVYNIKYAESVISALIAIGPTVVIFGIFSLILLLSAFGGWGKLLRKLGRHSQAEQYEESVKESEKAYKQVKTKYEKSKKTKKSLDEIKSDMKLNRNVNLSLYEDDLKSRERVSKKSLITGIVILLICTAVAALTLWIYGKESRNVHNGHYIETTAVVMPVHIKDTTDEYALCYVYEDEAGNQYIYNDEGIFSGVNFHEGKTVKMYYNIHNPEIAVSGEGNIGLLVVSVLFLAGGVLVFLLNVFKRQSNAIVPVLVGGIFMFFGIGICIMISRAGGFNAIETMMSGPFAFASILFAALGLLFICFGLFNVFRNIYYFSLHLRKKLAKKDGI